VHVLDKKGCEPVTPPLDIPLRFTIPKGAQGRGLTGAGATARFDSCVVGRQSRCGQTRMSAGLSLIGLVASASSCVTGDACPGFAEAP